MGKFKAILYDTFLEIKVRKTFYLYWLTTAIFIILLMATSLIVVNGVHVWEYGGNSYSAVQHTMATYFGGGPGIPSLFDIYIFLFLFGSAGLLPSFLKKGRIEMALSKPLSRGQLLLMKFSAVYLVNAAIFAGSCLVLWGIICALEGIIVWSFFPGLIIALLKFFLVYSILFFFGLVSNSAAFAIMSYIMLWLLTKLILAREAITSLLQNETLKVVLDTVYAILPKFGEISDNYFSLISGNGFSNFYAVWTSALFGIATLSVALFIFRKRDY